MNPTEKLLEAVRKNAPRMSKLYCDCPGECPGCDLQKALAEYDSTAEVAVREAEESVLDAAGEWWATQWEENIPHHTGEEGDLHAAVVRLREAQREARKATK